MARAKQVHVQRSSETGARQVVIDAKDGVWSLDVSLAIGQTHKTLEVHTAQEPLIIFSDLFAECA